MDTTIVETDEGKVEFHTGEKTISQADFVITTTPTGLYQVETRSPAGGTKPAITEDRFTGLRHAKEAIAKYVAENAHNIRKRQVMNEGIARRKKEANVER